LGVTENKAMSDTTIMKVKSAYSPRGKMGQKYLASGVHVAMRLWEDEPPGPPKPEARREYETVGYVLRGRAELHLEGQMVVLEAGDSWVVPRGAAHLYKILEPFSAVEATCPPAAVHGRDECAFPAHGRPLWIRKNPGCRAAARRRGTDSFCPGGPQCTT
jgi:quercetin dioxygenase-like cupin family protein